MTTKSVLLSYLERNKVITIPVVKEGSDVQFIRSRFIQLFSFEKNVGLCLSFQKFDDEWQEYVELDDTEDVKNKEKIKVVVMPVLGTPGSSNDGTAVSYTTI